MTEKKIKKIVSLACAAVMCHFFGSLDACRCCRKSKRCSNFVTGVDKTEPEARVSGRRVREKSRRGKTAEAGVKDAARHSDAEKQMPDEAERKKREGLEREMGTLFKDCMDLNNKNLSFKQFAQECARLFKAAGDLKCVPREHVDRYKELAGLFEGIRDSTSAWSIGLKIRSYKEYFPECIKAIFRKCSTSSVLKVIKTRVKLNVQT